MDRALFPCTFRQRYWRPSVVLMVPNDLNLSANPDAPISFSENLAMKGLIISTGGSVNVQD